MTTILSYPVLIVASNVTTFFVKILVNVTYILTTNCIKKGLNVVKYVITFIVVIMTTIEL